MSRLPFSAIRLAFAVVCLADLASAATARPLGAEARAAAVELRTARQKRAPVEERAGRYLAAASLASPQIGTGPAANDARKIYNAATAELTLLLRSADGGRLWDRPLTVAVGGTTYRLRFAPASRKAGTWAPGKFDFFETPKQVKEKSLRVQVREAGVGGVLVGIHKPADPRKDFLPEVGVAAPVTAILDFKTTGSARDAVLALHDPTLRDTVRVAGAVRPMAADFTAPIAFYPHPRFLGMMEAMRVDRYFNTAALAMLQPYDPERIPVVFVHGLASAPAMWRDVIDAVEADAELRGRFQFWVFGYPTGDPISISALQLRESLAGVYRRYPKTKDMVLVSHSLGGLLSKMQTIDSERVVWDATFGADAERLHAKVPPDSIVKQALIFDANPRIKRVVFICVPHRGSPLADNYIGAVGVSLIHLPAQLVDRIQARIGETLVAATGRKGEAFPPSVHGLSQTSPLLLSLDKRPIQAPHHTILGDRGKGDSPNSSDGVVPYHSSHLASAQSQLIVPGPHGSYKLPECVGELRRILHLHLKSTAR